MIIKDDSLQYELDKLSFNDGDLLIFKLKNNISDEQLYRISKKLNKKIKKDVLPIFIPNDMEIETLSDENLKKICKERGLIND